MKSLNLLLLFNRRYWALNTNKWNNKKVTQPNILSDKSPYDSLETTCFAMKFWVMANKWQANWDLIIKTCKTSDKIKL